MQPDINLANLFNGLAPPTKPVDEAIIRAASDRLLRELNTQPCDANLVTILYHIIRGG